jgi:hypothetical protein
MIDSAHNHTLFPIQKRLARIGKKYRFSELYVFGSREKEVAELVRQKAGICGDPHRVDEYELYILRRGGDLLPLERERIRIILGGEG